MAGETNKLVEQLTSIVTTARRALAQHCQQTSTTDEDVNSNNINNALKSFFPSTGGNRSSTTTPAPTPPMPTAQSIWGGRGHMVEGEGKENSLLD